MEIFRQFRIILGSDVVVATCVVVVTTCTIAFITCYLAWITYEDRYGISFSDYVKLMF